MRRSITAPVVLVLLLAACGGEATPTTVPSGDTVPTTTPVVTTVPPTTTTSTDTSSSTTAPTTTSSTMDTTTTTSPLSLDDVTLRWVEYATGFDQPVFLTAPPDDPRIFVVDQPGRIWMIDDGDPAVYLDIRGRVAFGGERGLLGMAFHPDFASNGLFYLHYSGASAGQTVVAEYRAGSDPAVADPASERILYTTAQPAGNHNGGMIAFGPDGYLWIALGDGGGANDRFGNGQRTDTPLGALLRIDAGPNAPEPYGIPPDNPYAGTDGQVAELWAYGLRNPWRFSFDGDTLYIADVGQNQIEEIDVAAASMPGLNYGWPIMEGTSCFESPGCDESGLTLPAVVYTHSEGCSVTGGYVYRGSDIPEIDGWYFYSDYCSGFLRSLRWDGAGVAGQIDWTSQTGSLSAVTSFGLDAAGELYATSAGGSVFRLERG